MEIDAVEERAPDLRLVLLRAFWRAPAGERGVVQMPAAAGIHRRHQLHPRRICNMRVDARHRGAAALERLAERLEALALELRH